LKHFVLYILSAVILLSFAEINASAESAAFGYFINESGNETLDYLEKILPNSFASALKNKHDFDVIKPAQIPGINPSDDKEAKKVIREEDLQEITDDICADYFIYGSFKPIENNKIKLTIFVHKIGTTSVFQFEDTGYLETEIFKLVDKIAIQIKNIASESMIYKNETVAPKSKLAILTNIEGDELNSLYYEFLTGGYKISQTQGNEIYGLMDSDQIRKFYHLSGVNASFHMIAGKKDVPLWYGTWSSTEYFRMISEEKKALDRFSFNYIDTKSELLKKIKAFSNNSIDYIIIIGFDDCKSNAWIRCLSLKDNKLIITESEISGSSIDEITRKIIQSITTGLPNKI